MKPVGERKNREETISSFLWEGCLPAVIGELTTGVGGGICCLDSATLVGVGVIDSARGVRVMDMAACVVNSRNTFVVRAASGPLAHLKMIDTWRKAGVCKASRTEGRMTYFRGMLPICHES